MWPLFANSITANGDQAYMTEYLTSRRSFFKIRIRTQIERRLNETEHSLRVKVLGKIE